MKNIYTYSDLVSLEQNFKKIIFYYNSSKYGTYYHTNDRTPQVKNFTSGEKGMKFSSFMFKVRKELDIEQPQKKEEVIQAPIPITIDKLTDISKYISDVKEELPEPFMELMQLDILRDEYKTHQNIKLLDFEALNKDHVQGYKINKTLPILYFQNEDSVNVRYKWNGDKKLKGWFTLSDIYSRGAFLQGKGNSSTLLLLEGLKDGINGNIILGDKCDILIADSETSSFDWKLIPDFTSKKYKTILFIQDKNISDSKMLKMVQGIIGKKAIYEAINKKIGIGAVLSTHSEIFKLYEKIRFFNKDNYTNDIKDFTDIMESLNYTKSKLKLKALKHLKDNCSNERFISIYLKEEVKIIDNYLEIYMNTSNIDKFMYYTLKKVSYGGNIERDFKYYMNSLVKPPQSSTILHLDKSKFLSKHSKKIADFFKKYSHILLGSPTGTGKSTFVRGVVKKRFYDKNKNYLSRAEIQGILKREGKEFIPKNIIDEGLPLHFGNMIFIAPLTSLAVEAGQHPLFTHVEYTIKEGELGANLYSNYITLTTDTFEKLRTHPLTKDMMKKRIDEAELIVFDEQHYPHNAEGFRGLVTSSYKYLERYKGNVLYLSGTPIYAEAPHAHAVVTKLDRKFISRINFYIDPFKKEKDVLQSMIEHLEQGSILFYCKKIDEANRVHNVLLEKGYDVVKIISHEYLHNGKKVSKEYIAQLKGKIAYVATTKITTGANLDELIAIYQHGTAYDPFTSVQLTARMRANGSYYLIKVKNERVAVGEKFQNKAMFICNMAKKFNIKKFSDIWSNKTFQKYIKKNVELSYKKNDLKGFFNTYREAFQLIKSEGLGVSSRDNSDFEFLDEPKINYQDEPKTKISKLDENQIQRIFQNADKVGFRKFFEKIIIDNITRNGKVEVLNSVFELSFDYILKNDMLWSEAKGKEFITDEDEKERIEKKEREEELKDEFEEKINEKFNFLKLGDSEVTIAKILKKNGINNTALNKLLNDKRLDKKENKDNLIEKKDKVIKLNRGIKPLITAIKCYLISSTKIINTTLDLIAENEYTTPKEISEKIEQTEYLSTKKDIGIFEDFLKDFFIDDTFNKKDLDYNPNRKRINGKLVSHTITIPKEKLKEIRKIRDIEKREKARLEELNRVREKTLDKIEIVYEEPIKKVQFTENEIMRYEKMIQKRDKGINLMPHEEKQIKYYLEHK